MGLTIHYRGTLEDMHRVEEFENCVVQAVFAMGGKPTIWRSFADGQPDRVIRGLMVDLAEGLETLSLLLSPEGHFIPLFQIEECERQALEEPPYCFVKTQYGAPISHVCTVLLLDAIRERFASSMEIVDESEFLETRDFSSLIRQQKMIGQAIQGLEQELTKSSLSPEATEDPEIVATRIERIAKVVQQNFELMSCSEESCEDSPAEASWAEPSLEEEVEWFERQRRRDDLRKERIARRIQEALSEGRTASDALQEAMRSEGLDVGFGHDAETDESDSTSDSRSNVSEEESETWRVSLPETVWASGGDAAVPTQHPAVEVAGGLVQQLARLRSEGRSVGNFLEMAISGAMDCLGGLAQATAQDEPDRMGRAVSITQLRRALRGHAFARGAVFALCSENAIQREEANKLHDQLQTIVEQIHQLSQAAWDEDQVL